MVFLNRLSLASVLLIQLVSSGFAETKHNHTSKYAGEQHRKIKSLSQEDIDELSRGGGWGFARAAELNGVPGPAHLLELKDEIELSPTQIKKIEMLFEKMNRQAVLLGEKFIEMERELDMHFKSDIPNAGDLENMLREIALLRSQLRFVHLSTHLKTPTILSQSQIDKYNVLRGYDKPDNCSNPPKGHNLAMWRKHNGCEE